MNSDISHRMMKATLTGFFILCFFQLAGQQYRLNGGEITFYSYAPMENIEAASTKVLSLYNAATGEIAFVVPIRSFVFPKKLMQEHFNENYLESHKFPDATFKGKITGFDVNLQKKQKVKAKGVLTIHGESQETEVEGFMEPKTGALLIEAKFPLKVADYKIEIPQLLFYNIAEEVEITLNGKYVLYEKK